MGTGSLVTGGPLGLSSACSPWATTEAPAWDWGGESYSTLISCLEEQWLLALLSSSSSDMWRSLLRRLLDLLVDSEAIDQWSSWDSWSLSKKFKVFSTLMVNLSEKRTLNTTYTCTVHHLDYRGDRSCVPQLPEWGRKNCPVIVLQIMKVKYDKVVTSSYLLKYSLPMLPVTNQISYQKNIKLVKCWKWANI